MNRTLLILSFGTSFVAICFAAEMECYIGSLTKVKSNLDILPCIPSPGSAEKNKLTFEPGGLSGPSSSDTGNHGEQNTTVTHCLIYTHGTKGDDQSSSTDFYCDFDHKCSTVSPTQKVGDGVIHCCNSSQCNAPSTIGLELPSLQCYTGAVIQDNTSIATTYCKSEFCISAKFYKTSGSFIPQRGTQYKCDDEHLCRRSKILNGCQNVTSETGGLEEVCCCSTSNCNKPVYVINGNSPIAPMPDGGGNINNSHSNMMYIGGVLCATLVAVLVTTGLIIVIRKCKQRKDEHVRYIYSQLTADLSEEVDDDDAYMIVA